MTKSSTLALLFTLTAGIILFLYSPFPLLQQKSTLSPKPPRPTLSPAPSSPVNDYILEYSEGDCTQTSQCQWAGQGCGGGHGVCTNNPGKYKDAMSTCDVNMNFPSNKGYSCGCIAQIGKCGWQK